MLWLLLAQRCRGLGFGATTAAAVALAGAAAGQIRGGALSM